MSSFMETLTRPQHPYVEYSKWEDVPSNLKTKSRLKKLHLVPGSDEKDGLVDNEEYHCVALYDMIQAIYVIPKEHSLNDGKALPSTKNNLMVCLYIVQRSIERRSNAFVDLPRVEVYHKNEMILLEDIEKRTLEKFLANGIEYKEPKKFEEIKLKDAFVTLQEYLSAVEET